MSLPTKEGFLYKYGGGFIKKWSYRYFKLSRDYLHYFEAQHAPSPRESAIRTEITSVAPCAPFSDKQNCFTLVIKSHDKWYLAANTVAEMEEWIACLRAHLPPSEAATGSGSEKKALSERESEEKRPPSPSVMPPPLPSYMADQLVRDSPPSYDESVKHSSGI